MRGADHGTVSESDAAPAPAAPAAPAPDMGAAVPTARVFTLKEAARETGIARSVFQRNRDKLVEHGATVRPNGTWAIPLETLVAIGWLDRVRPTADVDDAAPAAPIVDAAPAELAELRAQLAAAEQRAHAAELRAAAAEATAAERERALAIARQAADDQRMALRLLESAAPQPSPEPERRGWFGGGRRGRA